MAKIERKKLNQITEASSAPAGGLLLLEVDGTAQSITVDNFNSVERPTRTLAGFGAVGNTVIAADGTLTSGTDDTLAIQAAFDWMAAEKGRKIVADPSAVYRITDTITCAADVNVDFTGAKFFKTTTGFAFQFTASHTFYDLSADYTAGATSIAVSNTGTALAKGTPFVIVSDAITPYNRDEGSETNQFRVAEWAQAGVGSTTTSIAITRPLRRIKGIDPADANITNAGAEESIVAAYTTALNSRVAIIDFKDMDIKGLHVQFEEGHGSGEVDEWGGDCISVRGYRGRINDAKVSRGYDGGIGLTGTFNFKVENPDIQNLEDDTSNGFFGYGIGDNGWGTVVTGMLARNLRHAYKPGSGLAPADSAGWDAISQASAQGFTVAFSKAFDTSAAAWDSHHGAFDGLFDGCYAEGCDNFGFGVRGTNITLNNPIVRNCKGGITCFTDYSSGSTNDDLWLAGKDQKYFTNCRIINPDIECSTTDLSVEEFLPIRLQYATVSLEGKARIRANSHVMALGEGELKIDASVDFKMTDFDGALSLQANSVYGFLHPVAATDSDASGVLPDGTVYTIGKGADIKADLTAVATGTPGLVVANSNTSVVNRGYVYGNLSSSCRVFSGGGTITTPQGGMFEWEVDGAADDSITTALASFDANAQAVDGSAFWKGPLPNNEMQMIFNESNSASIAGTGSEIANAYVPPLAGIKAYMGGNGEGRFRLKQSMLKTGGVGTAKLKYDSFGAFFTEIDLSAGDNHATIEIDVTVNDTDTFSYMSMWLGGVGSSGKQEGYPGTKDLSGTGGISGSGGNMLDFDPTIAVGDTIDIISTEIWATAGGIE